MDSCICKKRHIDDKNQLICTYKFVNGFLLKSCIHYIVKMINQGINYRLLQIVGGSRMVQEFNKYVQFVDPSTLLRVCFPLLYIQMASLSHLVHMYIIHMFAHINCTCLIYLYMYNCLSFRDPHMLKYTKLCKNMMSLILTDHIDDNNNNNNNKATFI